MLAHELQRLPAATTGTAQCSMRLRQQWEMGSLTPHSNDRNDIRRDALSSHAGKLGNF